MLLDTHVLVWWLYKPELLSVPARKAINSGDNRLFVSAVSAYEIAAKHRLGKWPEVAELTREFDDILVSQSITSVPIASHQARMAALFHAEHRDPFDRLLAAQALSEEFHLITRDPVFAHFGVLTIW
ncbi:type II toxin-antitoxin system VapC family toxin [Aureimonas leprariae]|uniref:type II toxin-antitoxin system VapC family toxin n=1 Tax=Plantimonas leprariae TaxID=2615207 RepID=UPI001386E22E|nr:type II toxin-antitoxin system VapC family toxin [Aureimonas leprariae]